MKSEKNVALIGGTGKAGKFILNELITKGYTVKILARDPLKVTINNPQVEVIKGDATNYNDLKNLISGCNCMISSLGARRKDDPFTNSKSTALLVSLMEEFKIDRYIFVTGTPVDVEGDKKGFKTRIQSFILSLFFKDILKDKQMSYEQVRNSNIQYSMVRIPFLNTNLAKGKVIISLEDVKGNRVSAQDLSEFIIQIYEQKQFIRQSPFIASV